MHRTTIIGLVSGATLIVLAIIFQGGFFAFFSFESLLIVVGGVAAATLVNYSLDDLMKAWRGGRDALTRDEFDLTKHVEVLTMFARRARRQGLLTIDEDIRYIEDDYLRSGLELAVDGIPEENLKSILDDELKVLERRQRLGVRVLGAMGDYSPAFGMIGTLIGLILMLRNLDNPGGIGPGLSIALLTTFYGTMLANLVFIPLSGKLEEIVHQDVNEKEMMRVGILSLADAENPRIMEKKMLSYVTPEERSLYRRTHSQRGITASQEENMYDNWINKQQDKWENALTDLQTG